MLNLPQTARPGDQIDVMVQIRGGVMIAGGRKDGYRLRIDWGDGEAPELHSPIGMDSTPARGTTTTVPHRYTLANDYTVRIEAVDATGRTESESRTIRITDVPPIPAPTFSETRPVLRLVRIEGPANKRSRSGLTIGYEAGSCGMLLHFHHRSTQKYRSGEPPREFTHTIWRDEQTRIALRVVPVEIVMGEPFVVEAELKMRNSYSAGYPCVDPPQVDLRHLGRRAQMNLGVGSVGVSSQAIYLDELGRFCQNRSLCRTRQKGLSGDGYILGYPCGTGMTEPDAEVRLIARFIPDGIDSINPYAPDGTPRRATLVNNPPTGLQTGESRMYRYRVEHGDEESPIRAEGVLFREGLDVGGVYSSSEELALFLTYVSLLPTSATPTVDSETIRLIYRRDADAPIAVPEYSPPDVFSRPPRNEPWIGDATAGVVEVDQPPDDEVPTERGAIDPSRPEVAALIREWLAVAEPVENADGASFRYDAWGRLVGSAAPGRGRTVGTAGPPDGGGVPETYAWGLRTKLDSMDHCMLEEYVRARLANTPLTHCSGRYQRKVVVPDVTGASLSDAMERLRQQGFQPAPSLLGPASRRDLGGCVAAQRSVAGTPQLRGATVELDVFGDFVELRVPVPALGGLPLADAMGLLRRAGLAPEPSLLGAAPSAGQAGRVHAQVPAPGTAVEPGTTVRVDVWGDHAPAAQPKRGIICFTRRSPQGHGASIHVIRPDGSNERKIVESAGSPRLSYDGRMIVYQGFSGMTRFVEICGIDGTGRRRPIITAGDYTNPVWTADGRGIYFTFAPAGTSEPDWRLAWVKIDGTGFGQARLEGYEYLPAPDGARAAFRRHVANGSVCIHVTRMGQAGTSGQQLTHLPGYPHGEAGLSWSPDSSKLALIRYNNQNMSVCTVPSKGGPVRVLASVGKCHWSTAWSHDMTHILIVRRIPGPDGRETEQLAFVKVADGTVEPFAAAGVGIVSVDWR